MGLSRVATGASVNKGFGTLERHGERVIALAGNPNVGKSTVFNALTGLRQHTGNWTGKTVTGAEGRYCHNGTEYIVVDLPGTYSLSARSKEEEVARDFIAHGGADAVVIVADATCLERNLSLVLQTMELCERTVLCVNLMDEAKKKNIAIDLPALERRLNIPVVGASARNGEGLDALMDRVDALISAEAPAPLRLAGASGLDTKAHIAALYDLAADICREAVSVGASKYNERQRKWDRLLTGRWTGGAVMLSLLALVFFLTIVGANYPSALLTKAFGYLEGRLSAWFVALGAPWWLRGALVDGMFRTLAWIVAVMLPPMAIFFPLFTLLEDIGYLPRVAFNLDSCFKRCHACGKQSLTMCMGFGCNAAGVIGCRIIDSPRERLIGIITNNFVPCNGRFPILIAIITMFFAGRGGGIGASILSALLLTAIILAGVGMTFLSSRLLSSTILKGVPSSFALELPPFRKPKIGQVLVRSVLDRTLFVLGRAVVVAAPAGLLLWVLANVSPGGISLLSRAAQFIDPVARFIGLDGAILMAFIMGFPANEVVLPIVMMIYMSAGSISGIAELEGLRALLVNNGWTAVTALCMMAFTLMHWPCSTTLLTIRKETGGIKWMLTALAVPTIAGVLACLLIASAARLIALF